MKIKNIVFDFGGVLIDWDPRYLYRKIFDNEEKMEFFLENICTPEWNEQQDAGRSFAEATEILVKQHPEHEENIRLYYSRWIEMIVGSIQQNTDLISPLKKKFRLFGLTNWSGEAFPMVYNDPKYGFFKELEGIVVSGDEKLIKPDERIYNCLLERYSLTASECLFIDDNIRNIEAAEKLGFNTIHLPKGKILKEELLNFNIEI